MATATAPTAARLPGWVGPAAVVAAVGGVAAAGGVVTARAIESGWYDALQKPDWTPPNDLFGPVWAALYLMMAAAACLVWAGRHRRRVTAPLALFGLQLALNLGWTVCFFGLRRPQLALADNVLLWAAVGATAAAFFPVSKPAGWLLVPYWAWVTFALVLTAAVTDLNP